MKRIGVWFILVLLVVQIVPISFVSAAQYNFQYDSSGNLIQSSDKYYEYNDFNELERVRANDQNGAIIVEYSYDHEGNRIKKVEYNIDLQFNNRTTYYIDKSFIQIRITNGTVINETYYYDENILIARKDNDGKKFFYHPDHLGSTNLVTNQSGNIVEETFYLPYGEVLEGEGDRFQFTGKEKDSETELNYYGARYYDSELKHFTQADSVLAEVYDPQQLNKYGYARDNPYKYVDPSGNYLSPLDILDYASLVYSTYALFKDPSLENAGFFGLDLVSAAVPVIGGAGFVANGGKFATKIDDVSDAGKITGYGDEAAGAFRNVFGNDNRLILKSDYPRDYAQRLEETSSYLSQNIPDYKFTEHSLNSILGRIDQGRIDSIQSVENALTSGHKYYDPQYNNIVYAKDNVLVHVDPNVNEVITVTEGNVKGGYVKLD